MSDTFDLTGKSLEDAMICYAIRAASRVYRVSDWDFFKSENPCENTAQELYDRFWNVIIPDKDNYDIVRNKPAYGFLLSFITNPIEVGHARPAEEFEHIKSKDLFTALKEEDKRKERARFEDPMVLLIKETCEKVMHRQQREQPSEQSTLVSPRQSLIHSRVVERDRSSRSIRSSTIDASVSGATGRGGSSRAIRSSTSNASTIDRDRSPLATAQSSFIDAGLGREINDSVSGGTDDHTGELRHLETGSNS